MKAFHVSYREIERKEKKEREIERKEKKERE
jgi:hypothetical protein